MQTFLNDKEIIFLNQIFAKLYEDEDYEKAFTIFLESLKEIVSFQKGDIYFYHDEDKHIVFDDFIFVDWGEESLSSYMNDYADMDDVLPIVSLNHPVMFRSSDVFLQDERIQTKYYNELLLPEGMHHSIEGNIYNDNEGVIAGIGIHRPDELGDFTQKELEILKLSRPHLLNVARKFVNSREEMDVCTISISALCDIDDIGLCIFDDKLNIIDSNLVNNDFIRKDHLPEMMRSLITLCKSLIARMKNSELRQNGTNNKSHSRITIGKESYYAEVTYREGNAQENSKFIAMVYNRSDLFDKLIREVCDRYGLTTRECEILNFAIRGMSNVEIGRELFISVPTVKKHLTNIYNKMEIEGKHQVLGAILE